MKHEPLTKIIITKEPDGTWLITRQRHEPNKEGGGESMLAEDLDAAFAFVRRYYDEHGERLPEWSKKS